MEIVIAAVMFVTGLYVEHTYNVMQEPTKTEEVTNGK